MTAMATPHHRVASVTAHLRAVAEGVASASVWSMTPAETATTLVELQVGHDVGATSTAKWWAHQTKQTRPAAARIVRLGYDLGTHDLVRDALAAGDLQLEQAQVIIGAVKALPEGLDPGLVIKAERYLVGEAAEHDARTLRILGRRLLEVVAPDLADRHEADLLEREEAKAAQATRLTMTDDGHGRTHGRFTLPAAQAAMLKKYLLALAAPKHVAATHGPGVERRPGPERMGTAFCELIERVAATDLPQAGGTDATVVITIDLDTLTGKIEKAGVLDTGDRISPTAARRLACTAGIVPIVLGAQGEVLDVGRKQRLFTKAQRTALGIRDGGCTAQGCDWPPGLCHAHHDDPWSRGGPTDLANGRLLCPRHHARAHDPTYETTRHPDGQVSFRRRS